MASSIGRGFQQKAYMFTRLWRKWTETQSFSFSLFEKRGQLVIRWTINQTSRHRVDSYHLGIEVNQEDHTKFVRTQRNTEITTWMHNQFIDSYHGIMIYFPVSGKGLESYGSNVKGQVVVQICSPPNVLGISFLNVAFNRKKKSCAQTLTIWRRNHLIP